MSRLNGIPMKASKDFYHAAQEFNAKYGASRSKYTDLIGKEKDIVNAVIIADDKVKTQVRRLLGIK